VHNRSVGARMSVPITPTIREILWPDSLVGTTRVPRNQFAVLTLGSVALKRFFQ